MIKCKIISVMLILLFAFSISAYAAPQTDSVNFNSELETINAQLAPADAKAAILVECQTGKVLYSQDAEKKLPIASVTKIMTLCLIFDKIESGHITKDDIVTVSDNAAGMGGSQVFLESGGKYPVKELVKSIIIASANDACVAMAEYISGTQDAFVLAMNQKAKQLGMNDTHFVNCTGMPHDEHLSTAADVAKMSAELIKHDMFFSYSSIWMDEIKHSGGRVTGLTNTNKLVRFFDGCDGIKTGYTSQAGHCVAATVCRDGMRLISVIIGGQTSQGRFDDARRLLNYGFATFTKLRLAENVDIPQGIKLEGGMEKYAEIILKDDPCIVINKNDAGNVAYTVNLPPSIKAPLKDGDVVGDIVFSFNGQELARVNIVVSGNYKQATVGEYFNKLLQHW